MLGYVLNQVTSEPSRAAETNPAALLSLTSVPCLGEIPYVEHLETKRSSLADLFAEKLDLRPVTPVSLREQP